MNRHSSANLYYLLLFFIAPFFSMHGASLEVEKLIQQLKNGSSGQKIYQLMQETYASKKVKINAVGQKGVTFLLAILENPELKVNAKINLINQLLKIAEKTHQKIDINQKDSSKTTPIEAILRNQKLNVKEQIQLINKLWDIAKKTNQIIVINEFIDIHRFYKKPSFTTLYEVTAPLKTILENEKLDIDAQIKLIDKLFEIGEKTKQTIQVNWIDGRRSIPLVLILKNKKLNTDSKIKLINKLFEIAKKTKQTINTSHADLDGTTPLGAILSNQELNPNDQIKLIDKLSEIAKKAKKTINVNQVGEDGDTPLLAVLLNENLNITNQTTLINKLQKIAEETGQKIDINQKNSLEITPLLAIIINSKLDVNAKISLINQLCKIAKKTHQKIDTKALLFTAVDAMLNKNFNPNDQVVLIEKIYSLLLLDSSRQLDDRTKRQIKRIFSSLRLTKDNRKKLTKLTGISVTSTQNMLYCAKENLKSIIIFLLVLLGTIVYGIWQYLRRRSVA